MSKDLVYQEHKLLEQEYRVYDGGESKYTYLNKWNYDEEPGNISVENWASCTVRRIQKPITEQGDGGLDESKSNKSFATSSMRSSLRMSKISKVQNSQALVKGQQQQQQKKKEKEESGYQIEKLIVQEIPEEVKKKIETIERNEDRRRQERELKFKQQTEEEEKKRKKQAEDDQKQQILKETKKMLKNRPFTYDFDGKIVFVKHLKTDTFPAEIFEMEINEGIPIEVALLAYKKLNINIPDYKPKEEPVIIEEEPKKNKRGYIINRPQTAKPKIKEEKNNQQQNLQIQLENDPNLRSGQLNSPGKRPLSGIITPSLKSQIGSPTQRLLGRKKEDTNDPFLPKSPQLNEILDPVTGVQIKFPNGLIKQGGEIKKENRMRKADYQELVENQPKKTYLQEYEIIPQEVQEILQEQQEQEQQDELDIENQAQLLKKNKRKVRILEEREYIRMMKTQVQGPKGFGKPSSGSQIQLIAKPKQKKIQLIKSKNEIITYKKGVVTDLPNLYEKQSKKGVVTQALSKASQVVQEFNKKQILKNPNWGIAQQKQTSAYDQSSVDQPSTATNFRQKKQIKQLQISVGEQMFIVGGGNRPVSSKNLTKRQSQWRPISAVGANSYGIIATPAHKDL